MGSLFNCQKSRTAKLNENEQAIFECKKARDKIKDYIKSLQKNEKIKKEKAKQSLLDKNKEKAKLFLKQSKMYREQANSANGQLTMIEDQIISIEAAQNNKDILRVLEQGNKTLKKLNEEVNIEKWEQVTEDLNEMKQQQEEIGNFLKNRGIEEGEFDEAVDKELENLMKLQKIESENEIPSIEVKDDFVLPEVVKKAESNEEKKNVLVEA